VLIAGTDPKRARGHALSPVDFGELKKNVYFHQLIKCIVLSIAF